MPKKIPLNPKKPILVSGPAWHHYYRRYRGYKIACVVIDYDLIVLVPRRRS